VVLVITADDFGLEPSVNAAISAALASGWVTHSSLLANTVHAEEACELARKHGAADRIGLHFNLSEGVPLTSAMSASKTFCSDGRFLPVENFPRYASLNAVDREAVAAELRAQFDAIRRFGIRPSHLDSHNDVHVAPSIARIVADVARDAGLSRVRISRNCGRRQGVVRRFQHRAYNLWLGRRGLRGVDYRGTADDVQWLADRQRLHSQVRVEVMTHPRLDPSGAVCDAPTTHLMQDRAARLRALMPGTI
jgi:predicted glycoside hydrolase/deacetylase ChbG (UPF0249 family)